MLRFIKGYNTNFYVGFFFFFPPPLCLSSLTALSQVFIFYLSSAFELKYISNVLLTLNKNLLLRAVYMPGTDFFSTNCYIYLNFRYKNYENYILIHKFRNLQICYKIRFIQVSLIYSKNSSCLVAQF